MTEPPILTLQLPAPLTWEQHQPGGCRCLCGMYHPHGVATNTGCPSAAEPSHFLRLDARGEAAGPLPVCTPCYLQLAAVCTS